jgi:hypothetical protein
MAGERTVTEPRTGQIWESKDSRDSGRRVRIVNATSLAKRVAARNVETDRFSAIRRDELQSRWFLVRDVPSGGEADALAPSDPFAPSSHWPPREDV